MPERHDGHAAGGTRPAATGHSAARGRRSGPGSRAMAGASFAVVALLAVGLAGTAAGAGPAGSGPAPDKHAAAKPAAATAAVSIPSQCRKPPRNARGAQLSMEKFLQHPGSAARSVPGLVPAAITPDGRSSAADCADIVAFQKANGIRPADGRATADTVAVTHRYQTVDLKGCRASRKATTVCVDQSSQTMWVVDEGKTVLGPRPIRTGKKIADDRTPNGSFSVTAKKRHTVSSIYHEPLPYWQQFNGPFGFHQTDSYLYGNSGSHGCVNMLPTDAAKLFKLTKLGSKVHIFGAKPGH